MLILSPFIGILEATYWKIFNQRQVKKSISYNGEFWDAYIILNIEDLADNNTELIHICDFF